MSTLKLGGIALISAGMLGLAYGGFTYTRNTHEAKLGSLEMSIKDHETLRIPLWAGVGAVVVGGLMLVAAPKAS